MQRELKKTKNGKRDDSEHIPIGGILRQYFKILINIV